MNVFRRHLLRGFVFALVVVIGLNALFLVFGLRMATLSRQQVRERVRAAYAAGDLHEQDHSGFDARRGFYQYGECLILQMISNDDPDPWAHAAGPLVYQQENWKYQCATLHRLLTDEAARSDYVPRRYARYWHGYNTLAAILLSTFPLAEVRQGLKAGLYGAIVLLGLTGALISRQMFALTTVLATSTALFWAVPYFGQSLQYAPGDIFAVLGAVAFLAGYRHLVRLDLLIPFCAAYGAGATYLEFLTGVLPTAAGLLCPLAYLVAISSSTLENRARAGWTAVLAALVAFTLGSVMTVAAKQTLVVLVMGQEALDPFLGHLKYYMGPATETGRLRGIMLPLEALLRHGSRLTYGSELGALLLYAGTFLAWVMAIGLAIYRRRLDAMSDILVFAAGASVVFIWTVLLPKHTLGHSPFMVRTLIVPISLGWGALAWQLASLRTPRG